MTVLVALVAGALLLYLPGWVISRVVPGAAPADVLERHYERVVLSALVSGWLALLLAEWRFFSLGVLLLLVLLLCGALAGVARWRGWRALTPNPSPRGRGASDPPAPVGRRGPGDEGTPPPSRVEIGAFALVGVVALLLVVPPFQVILGVRDAGVYSNAGFAIARTGGLVQYDALVAALGQAAQSDDAAMRGPAEQALSNFLGVQHPERFIATRMRAAGFFIHKGDVTQGRVVPQGFHLLPAWVAILTSMGGLGVGLFAPGLMGVLGAWSVGMLGRRLVGGGVGVLAFLLLALNAVQVWFSRYSTAETTMQFLSFAALYFFALFQQNSVPPRRQVFAAGVAGVAAGQLALTRIDFVLVVIPLLLYLLWCAVAHRWRAGHTALAAGLGVLLLHAGLHTVFIARAYFFDTAYARLQDYAITAYASLPFLTPLLREVFHTRTGSPLKDPWRIWQEVAGVALVVGALVALWRWPRPLHALEGWARRWQRPLAGGAALLLLLLAGYAYLVRPQVITREMVAALPRCLTPQQLRTPDEICLRWQGYVGAPVPLPPPPPQVDAATVKANDPVTYYEGGLVALLSHMQPTHPRYADAERYRRELPAVVRQLQEQGPNAALQEERAAMLAELDTLSAEVVGRSFEELCALNVFAPKIDEKYVVPLANLVRVGWYLSPLGVALGVVGFALWWWRGLDGGAWLLLVVGVVVTFFFVRQTYGTSDQTYIYILRRFVPVSYPALALGMAYALVGAGWGRHRLLMAGRGVLVVALVAFLVVTGRPIYRHVEYAGALEQVRGLAGRFAAGDVLLMRGGGPAYGHFRDVPDLVATPLRFAFGVDALTVKSSEPGRYAAPLAEQVRRWQAEGRGTYLLLSASGGDMLLPGFALERVGTFTLHLPEFEQLTDQKPHNVASLTLPMAIYRLDAGGAEAGDVPTLAATDFAAQVRGFYLPESGAAGVPDPFAAAAGDSAYAWTDGDALLRLPWEAVPQEITVRLAGGERPPHLGAARVCLSLVLEETPWPTTAGDFVPLDCFDLTSEPQNYRVSLAGRGVESADSGRALLRLESASWIPAEEDPRLLDQRSVGVQFYGVSYQ